MSQLLYRGLWLSGKVGSVAGTHVNQVGMRSNSSRMISPFVYYHPSCSLHDSRFELLGEHRLVSYQCHANGDEWRRITMEIEKRR
jgi:hypothetical protein